jgi:hypothetical protein
MIEDKSYQSSLSRLPEGSSGDQGLTPSGKQSHGQVRALELKRRWIPLAPRVQDQLQAFRQHESARAERGVVGTSEWLRRDVRSYLSSTMGWGLPPNFTRHYLRSSLVGEVSSELIDAYLGHWVAGAEPWWNGSCLEPQSAAHKLHQALDSIFPESDWPVIECFK